MSVLWHFLSLKKQFSSLSNRVVHRRSSAPPPIDNAILTIQWPLQILRQHHLALALALSPYRKLDRLPDEYLLLCGDTLIYLGLARAIVIMEINLS
jgi:hypothetical protein